MLAAVHPTRLGVRPVLDIPCALESCLTCYKSIRVYAAAQAVNAVFNATLSGVPQYRNCLKFVLSTINRP